MSERNEVDVNRLVRPVLQPRLKWWLMSIAKRLGGWDLWLGQKYGWDLDDDPPIGGQMHWHTNHYPWVVYRDEY